jgi:hypothetical protein
MLSWFCNLFRHRPDLVKLRDDTNVVLDAAPKSIGGPVNWANLLCTQAEEWRDETGACGLRVWISEADPSATELHLYVARALHAQWGNVAVVTEW